jgi:hypothetical protein
MCHGIWAKLKYEHHKRRKERRGKKWQGYYKQTLSLPSKFVLWMSFSFTTDDTRKSVWSYQGFVFTEQFLTIRRCFATKQKLLIRQGWQTYLLHGANSPCCSSTTWWAKWNIYCCTCRCFECNTNDTSGFLNLSYVFCG